MQFSLSDEQEMIRDTAVEFFAEQATSIRTRTAMASDNGYDAAMWQAFGQELGLAGVALPDSHGGAGLGVVELALITEAAGYQVASLPLIGSLALAAPALLAGGTDEQRTSWLPRLATGERIGALAQGDFSFENGLLTGTAPYVTYGAAADVFIVLANDGAGYVVPAHADGVVATSRVTMDQTRPHSQLVLNGAACEMLGDAAAARAAALRVGWIAIAADSLGGAQACLDRTVAYAKERVQFGRTIGSFQAIKHRLADMMVEIEQARSAVWWAACATDEADPDAQLAAHSAKAFACDAYMMCAGAAIQLHGGIGFTWEHDAHLFFKRAQANMQLLGSPDWHREQVACLMGLGTVG